MLSADSVPGVMKKKLNHVIFGAINFSLASSTLEVCKGCATMTKDRKAGFDVFVEMMRNFFVENENMDIVEASIMAEKVAKIYEKQLLYMQNKPNK